ncbi:MAG: phenylacetate-CoA oxygenase/reductase subunit PaaK [Alphaproteobacteria bacterium]|nr:phenylacetate-CoA oxygenase/reductase subunit PaaK [Alphaproteobacteria bacterium]
MSLATAEPPSQAAPHFHWLGVADVRRETADAVSIAFAVPPELAGHYKFRPGQYLTLRATLDGEEVRRSYSICSGLDDGELRIAIKATEGGLFSTWAQQGISVGDRIEVMTPTGRFGAPLEPDKARVHVAIAAGSGITPVMSLMKSILARESQSRFFLFYGSRATGAILFRGVLEDLKDRYLGRLSVFHVLSREEQDVDALYGRLDRERLGLLLRTLPGGVAIDHVYICGPIGMLADAEAALAAASIAPERVHIERFTSALSGRPRTPVAASPAAPPHALAAIVRDGARVEIPVLEGEAVLDAALRAGIDLPYACKGGMCCSCRARLVEGRAEMDVNYSLEPWEIEAGFVLTCQARPSSARLVVDYDHQ